MLRGKRDAIEHKTSASVRKVLRILSPQRRSDLPPGMSTRAMSGGVVICLHLPNETYVDAILRNGEGRADPSYARAQTEIENARRWGRQSGSGAVFDARLGRVRKMAISAFGQGTRQPPHGE